MIEYDKFINEMKKSSLVLMVFSVAVPVAIAEGFYVSNIGFNTCNSPSKEYHHHYVKGTECEHQSRPKDGLPLVKVSLSDYSTVDGELDSRLIDVSDSLDSQDRHHVFILGDSFVQAEEVEQKHHFAYILRNKLKDVYRVSWHGYSSWSPVVQYRFYKDLVNRSPKLKASKLVFLLFGNDFLPSQIDYSDQYYIENSINIPGNQLLLGPGSKFELEPTPRPAYYFGKGILQMSRRMAYALYGAVKNKLLHKDASASSLYQQNSREEEVPGFFDESSINDHITIANRVVSSEQPFSDMRAANMLFIDQDHWIPAFKESSMLTVNVLKEIVRDAKESGVNTVDFVYIPYGWEVSSCENFPGYTAYFPQQTFIPMSGIRSFLATQFNSDPGLKASTGFISYHDSTEFFRSKISYNLDSNCSFSSEKNQLYFAYDGHLNVPGHLLLSRFLQNIIF